jgi:putative heme-binding domain-containing protein
MFGALYVVADLDAYLADPSAYLAAHPLNVVDPLLKLNRPRTEWKLDDLTPAVAELSGGRSFKNARQMFQVANCIACHKLGGAGTQLGADLTKLDPKLTREEVLRDILEPSHRINEQYQSFVIETNSGTLHSGLVVEESPDSIKIIENPLAKAEPTVIARGEIASREKSATSIMPKGLLDKLTREEILDLLAFVIARGDEHHELFHGEHKH